MSNMIHIPLGSSRSKGLAVGLLASWLFTWTLPAKEWDRKRAESALNEARRTARHPQREFQPPPREEYLHCIDHYRQVYRLDPHFDGSDDAVFEAGTLYQEMSEIFENPEYANRALKLYRFLLSDYKTSPHCPEAEQNIATVEAMAGHAEFESPKSRSRNVNRSLRPEPKFRPTAKNVKQARMASSLCAVFATGLPATIPVSPSTWMCETQLQALHADQPGAPVLRHSWFQS